MDTLRFDSLLTDLRDLQSPTAAVDAATALQKEATLEDIPRLLELLKDPSFFVREAAAWPLSDLGYTDALPELVQAHCRGTAEGHDNDGLSAAMIDLASMCPDNAAKVLSGIISSGNTAEVEVAKWLLEFAQQHDV